MSQINSSNSILYAKSKKLVASNDAPSTNCVKGMIRDLFDAPRASEFDLTRLKNIVDEYCIPNVVFASESDSSEDETFQEQLDASVTHKLMSESMERPSFILKNETDVLTSRTTIDSEDDQNFLKIPLSILDTLPMHVLETLKRISDASTSGEDVTLLKESILNYFPNPCTPAAYEEKVASGQMPDFSASLDKGLSRAYTDSSMQCLVPTEGGLAQASDTNLAYPTFPTSREQSAMNHVHRELIERLFAFYEEVNPSKANQNTIEALVQTYGMGIWLVLLQKYDKTTVLRHQRSAIRTEPPLDAQTSGLSAGDASLLARLMHFYRKVKPANANVYTCKKLIAKYGYSIAIALTQIYGYEKVQQHFFQSHSTHSHTNAFTPPVDSKGLYTTKFQPQRHRRSSLIGSGAPHPLCILPPTSIIKSTTAPTTAPIATTQGPVSSELASFAARIHSSVAPDTAQTTTPGVFSLAKPQDTPATVFPTFLKTAVPGAFALAFYAKPLGITFRFDTLAVSNAKAESGVGVYLSVEEVLPHCPYREIVHPGDILLGLKESSTHKETPFHSCIGHSGEETVSSLIRHALTHLHTTSDSTTTPILFYFVRPNPYTPTPGNTASSTVFVSNKTGGFRFSSAPDTPDTKENVFVPTHTTPVSTHTPIVFEPAAALQLQYTLVPEDVQTAAVTEVQQMVIPGEKERRVYTPCTDTPQTILPPVVTQQCPGAFALKFFHLPLGITFAPGATSPENALTIQSVSDRCVYASLLAPGDLLLGYKQSGTSKDSVLEVLLGQPTQKQYQKLHSASTHILQSYTEGVRTEQSTNTIRPLTLLFVRLNTTPAKIHLPTPATTTVPSAPAPAFSGFSFSTTTFGTGATVNASTTQSSFSGFAFGGSFAANNHTSNHHNSNNHTSDQTTTTTIRATSSIALSTAPAPASFACPKPLLHTSLLDETSSPHTNATHVLCTPKPAPQTKDAALLDLKPLDMLTTPSSSDQGMSPSHRHPRGLGDDSKLLLTPHFSNNGRIDESLSPSSFNISNVTISDDCFTDDGPVLVSPPIIRPTEVLSSSLSFSQSFQRKSLNSLFDEQQKFSPFTKQTVDTQSPLPIFGNVSPGSISKIDLNQVSESFQFVNGLSTSNVNTSIPPSPYKHQSSAKNLLQMQFESSKENDIPSEMRKSMIDADPLKMGEWRSGSQGRDSFRHSNIIFRGFDDAL